jgi:4a-hydroxytetrahydrobiopterin dehydratase
MEITNQIGRPLTAVCILRTGKTSSHLPAASWLRQPILTEFPHSHAEKNVLLPAARHRANRFALHLTCTRTQLSIRSKTVTALSSQEIDKCLKNPVGWKVDNGALVRTFQFSDFRAALQFVNATGVVAEKAGHHPDIDIRYNKVRMALVTHDAGGITSKDFELATEINRLQET